MQPTINVAVLKLTLFSSATAHTPVIFMTAKVLKHEVDLYLYLGAVGVIGKPFDPMKLAGEIARLVEGSGAIAPLASSEASNERS